MRVFFRCRADPSIILALITAPKMSWRDDDVREGIKSFSDWPTIPQLYVKGEFVGGCDIVREMFENGELKTFLADKGVAVAAKAPISTTSINDRSAHFEMSAFLLKVAFFLLLLTVRYQS